jgi:Rrf2 family protein
MVCMALRGGVKPATKQEIASAERMSEDYAEQILMRLKTSGLVESHRGARGGFTFARAPQVVTVMDVIEAVEGPLALAPCAEKRCDQVSVCVTRTVWEQATLALRSVFKRTTIAMLAEKAKVLAAAGAPSFEI